MCVALLSCGTEQRLTGLALSSAERPPPRIARPVPPMNFRIDVRLARTTPPAASPRADEPVPSRYREWDVDELVRAMSERPVRRQLGSYRSTSPIYRLQLEGGLEVAFKPAIPGQETWWRHDVVAWRLARLLGIADRVPPAVARRVPVAALGDAVLNDGLITARDEANTVPGVVIFWLPVLRVTFLDGPRQRAQWQPWLDARRPMPRGHDAVVAAEISSVLVFDYLQANEDRWNDANIRADEADHLVYRDNNVGWFAFKMEDLTWGRTTLYGTQRFSRALVAALERATPEALRDEVARADGAGSPLIDARTLRAYGERRRVVLDHVRELRARLGDEAVLAFP
ncbi:MAG: hypothetical protein WCJ30_29075 [Deltaproteobacteria bacterium]